MFCKIPKLDARVREEAQKALACLAQTHIDLHQLERTSARGQNNVYPDYTRPALDLPPKQRIETVIQPPGIAYLILHAFSP